MTTFTITTIIEPTLAALARVSQGAGDVQQQVVGELGAEYLSTLKGETPRGRGERSPQLVNAYQTQTTYSTRAAQYRITNDTQYLRYVLNGRPAVEARPGKMLRFSINGVVFYRKRVKAAKANPFPARVKVKMSGRVAQAKRRMVELLIARFRS